MCVFKSFISLSQSLYKPLPVVLQATSGCTQQEQVDLLKVVLSQSVTLLWVLPVLAGKPC